MSQSVRVSFRDGFAYHVYTDEVPVREGDKVVRISNIEPSSPTSGKFVVVWDDLILIARPDLAVAPEHPSRRDALAYEAEVLQQLQQTELGLEVLDTIVRKAR